MAAYVGLDTFLDMDGAAIGRVESAELNAEQTYEHLTGAAGADSGVYSMIEPQGNASFWMQSFFPLNYARRTVVNGLPTVIAELQGGVAGSSVKKQTSCYINTWKISLEKGGAVKCDIEWQALAHTTGDHTAAPTALAKNLLLLWHEAGITLGGVAFDCQSITLSGENGNALDTDLDAKTSVERMPTVCKPGNEKITVEVDFASAPTVDIAKTDPGTVQLVFSCHDSAVTVHTLTTTVDNIHPVGLPIPVLAGEDEVVYKFTGELDYNDLASFAATYA